MEIYIRIKHAVCSPARIGLPRNGKIIPEMLADGRRTLVTAGCDLNGSVMASMGVPKSHQNGQFWEYRNTPLMVSLKLQKMPLLRCEIISSKAENSDCSWVQGEPKVNERTHLVGCQFLKPPWVYHIKLRCSGKLSTDILSQALTSHHIYKTSYAAVTGDEPRKQWY